MSTCYRALVRRDTYRDSVELMRVAAQLEQLAGVSRAALLMGTPANRAIMAAAGLLQDEAELAGPNDLVIAVSADDEDAAQAAIVVAERLLASQPAAASASGAADRPPPRTITEGVTELPSASLALISTPGTYATAEALKALKRGLHVFLFRGRTAAPPSWTACRSGSRTPCGADGSGWWERQAPGFSR
jgi:FdrA protein